jgi:hypothetical protein
MIIFSPHKSFPMKLHLWLFGINYYLTLEMLKKTKSAFYSWERDPGNFFPKKGTSKMYLLGEVCSF